MSFLAVTFDAEADGTALAGLTGEGTTWTNHPSYTTGALIQGGRVYAPTASRACYASNVPPSADYTVSGSIHKLTAATNAGICGRMDPAANTMYLLRAEVSGSNTDIVLYSFVTGTSAPLGTHHLGPIADGADASVDLVMVGDQISANVGGVLRIGPVTNTAVTAAGRVGVRIGTNTPTTGYHIDWVTATDWVTAPAGLGQGLLLGVG